MQPTLWFALHHLNIDLCILLHVLKELWTLVFSQLAFAYHIDLDVETTSELSRLLFCLMKTQASSMLAISEYLCMNLDSCLVENLVDLVVIAGYLGNLERLMKTLIMFSNPGNWTLMGCVPV